MFYKNAGWMLSVEWFLLKLAEKLKLFFTYREAEQI